MATIDSHEASPFTTMSLYVLRSCRGVNNDNIYFFDHLYYALFSNGLRTFRDAELLQRGKAIELSRVSIIVLSDYYASSRRCLEELVMILKRRSSGHLVLPVFFYVDPSEVRKQTGSFKEAFMRHEERIEAAWGEQKEYLKGKVQEWRMALREVADLAGFHITQDLYEAKIIKHVYFRETELVTIKNRAHPGRQDQCDFRVSRLEEERRGKRNREEIFSHVFSLDILQQHFGSKREDVAKSLGISVSTLKRHCRYHGIPRWPNRIRNNVSGLPKPHGEKNPLPTFNMLSTNGQITMENEVGGQNSEPNECLPDSFADPNFQNTGNGSIVEFGKTTFYDSLPGHIRDGDFCFSEVYSETEAAGGSSEWLFQVEGQTTQSTAYVNNNPLVFPQPHIASEEVLNENKSSKLTVLACSDAAAPNQPLAMIPTVPDIVPHPSGGSSKTFQLDKEMGGQIPEPNEFLLDFFEDTSLWDTGGNDSIIEIGKTLTFHDSFHSNYRDGDFCCSSMCNETGAAMGSSRWTFQLEAQTTQIPSYPIPDVLVSKPQITSIEVLSENMGSSEDGRILLASQEGGFGEGRVFESSNLTAPAFSDAVAPSQPLATILHTMPTIPPMVPQLIGGSSEWACQLKNQSTQFAACPNLSGLVDPHPQIASKQIPSENMGNLEDLSIFLVSQEPSMGEYGSINQTIPSCSDSAPNQQPMMPPVIASQDTSSVRVKATYGHKTVAFKLSFTSGMIQLKEEVSKRLGFELGNFNLEYKDVDGDWISIACDDDVRDYLQLLTSLGNQVSKLFVLDKVPNTRSFGMTADVITAHY